MRASPIAYDAGMEPSRAARGVRIDPWLRGAGGWTFTAPETGWYSIYLWGAGGAGRHRDAYGTCGGSGAALMKATRFVRGQSLSVLVGAKGLPGTGVEASGSPSTCTLSDGTVLTAGAGFNPSEYPFYSTGAGGVATGGDINLTGGAGSSGSGGWSPGFDEWLLKGGTVGKGGNPSPSSYYLVPGNDGQVVIVYRGAA